MNDLKNITLNFARFSVILSVIVLTLFVNCPLLAQSEKEPLSFNDARLWRSHTTVLSDDGKWYTNHYTLIDKPKSKKDTVLQQLVEKTSEEFYTDNNKTDVLYIHNVKSGLKYQIPDGSKPVFSNDSKWIAYKIVKKVEKEKKEDKKKDTIFIELKHLASDYTVRYESDATYTFPEDKNHLITESKNNLLIYDLDSRSEHFIGNVGEYLVDKKSSYIAYTINTEDMRGNGIYLYNPLDRTTRTLTTGNFIFSNLSWNNGKNALAAYRFNKKKKEVDYYSISITVIEDINAVNSESIEYSVKEFVGMPTDRGLAASPGKTSNSIVWSKDGKRLFVKLKEIENKKDDEETKKDDEEPTVQIWHWKDKKLLSERIMDTEKKKDKTYDAIFFRDSKKIVPLTGEEIQNLIMSKGTDSWAIGTDNREYISDWDVNKHDLYRIDLKTGEKELIEKGYRSRFGDQVQMSPDGTKAILWDEKDYWYYDIVSNTRRNITKDLPVSFIDTDYDKWGWVKNYGFVGWIKDRNAVMVNHKLDLWVLPIDKSAGAQNLTASVTEKDSIRFRLEDRSFQDEEEIADRYIDLSKPIFLNAFHTKKKYAGFYELQNNQLIKIIYEPAAFINSYPKYRIHKAKNSDAILFDKGDYQNYYETFLSDMSFSKPKKLSNTNPQQKKYIWGKRILIDYTNDDGVPLQGILSIPENYKKGEKLPMIVYTYEKVSHIRYYYSAPYLGGTLPHMLYVSNGYLHLYPDIHFNVGTPHSDMHECIDAAIEKVIELGYVDEDRIGYNGFSFGGHTGMYVATQNNKFAAISAGAGVSNLVQGFTVDIVRDGSNEQDYYMTSQGRLGTDPTSDTQMYISESPVFNAQNMNTPLLLYHGTDDKIVQWEHSFGYYNLLRYLKKPVVFLSYRGEGHGLRKEPNRLDFQRRLKEFFDHYLKGDEPKKWMVEEIPPYIPDDESKDKGKRALPKWK